MKKRWIILIIIGVLLIAARIALPFILKNVINDKLENLNAYTGSIEDVDLQLFRGAYAVDTLVIKKRTDSVPAPFFSAHRIDFSLQWEALFDGAIVGEIKAVQPSLNFTVSEIDGEEVKQTGQDVEWYSKVQELIPVKINLIEITDGHISYRNYTTNPNVNVAIDSLDLVVKNLSNVVDENEKLPASLEGNGVVANSGNFNVSADMNILKEIPDMDLNLKIENVALPSLNNYLKAFTNTDARDGTFNLYTEVLLNEGNIEGYVKPVLENIDLIKWKSEDEPLVDKIWESIVGGVAEIFENQPREQVATEIPLSGSVKDVDTGIGTTLWNVVKNAFIEALDKQLKNSINFENTEN